MGRLILCSGAGVSAESGLATFRTGDKSIWSKYNLDKVCNIETWRENYHDVHKFYNERRREIFKVEPNDFHRAVARWSQEHEVVNITQNIDDLFERAGCEQVLHLHGKHDEMVCMACDHRWTVEGDWNALDGCPNCTSDRDVKPAVIFFGEQAPNYGALGLLMRSIEEDDLIVVAGTSAHVVNFAEYLYSWKGLNVWVNPEEDKFLWPIYQKVIQKTAVDAIDDIEALLNP